MTLARGGALPALISLAMSSDPQRELHAVCALANIAEMVEGRTHERMIEEGVMKPLLRLADSNKATDPTTANQIASNTTPAVTHLAAGQTVTASGQPAASNNSSASTATLDGNTNTSSNIFNEIRREVARCFALFASKRDSHATLVRVHAASKMMTFSRDRDEIVARYGILGLGNLAVSRESHQVNTNQILNRRY